MKKIFAATALALSLAAVGASANAATFNLSLTDGTGAFSSVNYTPTTVFSDEYNFTISSTSDLTAAVTASVFTSSTSGLTSFSLKNLTTNMIYTATSTSTTSGKTTTTTYSIDASALTVGNYALVVTGKGTYGGQLYLTSAVPEASTTAMMLGGLALVGFVATRRRNAVKKENLLSFGNMAAA